MKTLIGHEYDVRVEHEDGVAIDGWFRARYLTPHAREMGWTWEICDDGFAKLRIDRVVIIEARPVSKEATP